MAYFPLFFDLSGQTGLVVGGGPVAFRKARVLLDFGPRLLVCAPSFLPELEALPGVERLPVPFSPELLNGVSLAIAATDCREVNHTVAQLCHARAIPVDVADSRAESSFLFPAVVRRGRLSVGISTGGASPAACAYVRQTLDDALSPALEPILDWLEEVREIYKARLPAQERSAFFACLFRAALDAGRPLSPAETDALLSQNTPEEELL